MFENRLLLRKGAKDDADNQCELSTFNIFGSFEVRKVMKCVRSVICRMQNEDEEEPIRPNLHQYEKKMNLIYRYSSLVICCSL